MCTWHGSGSASCHSLSAADRTVEQTNKQTNKQTCYPAVQSSSLFGRALQLTLLSFSSEKYKDQSGAVCTVSTVDSQPTGSPGNVTPRELRLRANYMQSENESSYQLPGTIE